MPRWPKRCESCTNCKCSFDRRPYGGNGYCSRCYRVVRAIKDAKAWDPARSETLRWIDQGLAQSLSSVKFETVMKKNYIRRSKGRLSHLRAREMMRSGATPVDPITIESKLARLLSFVRPKAKYPRNASYIAQHFNASERRVLYELLDDIEERVPWNRLKDLFAARYEASSRGPRRA